MGKVLKLPKKKKDEDEGWIEICSDPPVFGKLKPDGEFQIYGKAYSASRALEAAASIKVFLLGERGDNG